MKENEAIEKGIELEKLKEEQKKLSKFVILKDAFDFKLATRFAGIHIELIGKELLASIVVLNEEFEIIEEKYVTRPVRFPYIPGYRAYRELPVMLAAYDKLEEEPDVIFIEAQGIAHPRGLGLASHFGISINKPVIGITKGILEGEQKNDEIFLNGKVVASSLVTKKGSRQIYVSPGHMISLKTAIEVTKRCIKEPHKLPEPIVEARKSAANVREELQK
jgi:deoxyribonuclease V